MTDNEIIKMMKEEPENGQRALFDEYYSYVYAVAINILRGYGTAQDVEECVIDAFTKVFKGIDIEHEAAIKSFVGTVAKNCALSMRRSLKAKSGSSSLDSEEFISLSTGERIEEDSDKKETSELLLKQIEELGEPDSTIIIQKFFYERNSKEIGKIIGMSSTAVRMRCGRALKKLKKTLAHTV